MANLGLLRKSTPLSAAASERRHLGVGSSDLVGVPTPQSAALTIEGGVNDLARTSRSRLDDPTRPRAATEPSPRDRCPTELMNWRDRSWNTRTCFMYQRAPTDKLTDDEERA